MNIVINPIHNYSPNIIIRSINNYFTFIYFTSDCDVDIFTGSLMVLSGLLNTMFDVSVTVE